MTEEELADWEADFSAFQSRFAHLFQRSEPRKQAGKYLRGLMSEVQRNNAGAYRVIIISVYEAYGGPYYVTAGGRYPVGPILPR